MARTNYQHGKRLRELAKKQKREEKAARKKERKESGLAGTGPEILWDAAPMIDPEDVPAEEQAPAEETETAV